MAKPRPLTASDIKRYWDDGYLRLTEVFDASVIGRLQSALERCRAEGAEYDLLAQDKYGSTEAPDRGSFLNMFNLWRVDPDIREVAFDERLALWASQLIGTRQVRLLEDNSLYKEPGRGAALRWHQDQSYYPFPQPASVTAWIAVTAVTEQNGAVKVARGSHLMGERLPVKLDTGEPFDSARRSSTMPAVEQPEHVGLEVDVLELQPGDVSFHHTLTLHASGPNTTSDARQGYALRYAADGVTWLGRERTDYHYSDEEVGLFPGDELGGEFFPLVPHQT